MESVMMIVTLVALALCGVMATITARLLREERRRSAARVAMLESGISAGAAETTDDRVTRPASVATKVPAVRVPVAVPQPEPIDALPLRPRAETPRPATTPVHSAELFGTTARGSSSRARLAGIAIIGAILLATAAWLGVFPAGLTRQDAGASEGSGTETVAPGQPLQLLALEHVQAGDTLTISGIIRNPETGAGQPGLTAVVFVFDRQGSFVTSARALVDPGMLDPGKETPFAVKVEQARSVGRYRVSFRTETGVVPHVDRRHEAGRQAER